MIFPSLQVASVTPARILIVEDEGIIASHIASSLVRAGYEVAGTAESSEEALSDVANLKPDLILMDIRIKGALDGIETAAALRKLYDIPIIYLTAHTDQQTIDRAKLTGVSGFLTKPIHHATLAASIEMAIHKHRAEAIYQQAWKSALFERDRYSSLGELNQGLTVEKSRYHALVKATSQIVWTMTPQGAPTDAEEEWKAFTGQTGSELRSEALHPDDRPLAAAKWSEAMHTGSPYELEERVRRRDGEYCWMLARVVPVLDSDGSILEWIGACTDVGGRKRAEAEIKSLHEDLELRVAQRTGALAQANHELALIRAKLQSVLDAATQLSIIATDTDGTIEIFNSGAEKMLQYQAAEMEGLQTPEIIHDKREFAEQSLVVSTQFGHPIKGYPALVEYARQGQSDEREWTYVRKDGSRLDVSLAVTPLTDREGVLNGFLHIATDVTDRKSLERELRVNMEKLEEQTRNAEHANTAKSAFLAAMSHEIRTPMNAILGMSDMLAESDLTPEQAQYVEVFRRAGANLLIIINDILDLSKIEAGHLELERVDFDLEEVVDQAIELTGVKTRAKGIALLSRLSPGLTTALVGDPSRLRQVLLNLLGNAAKFTEKGEVLLTVQNSEFGTPGEIEFTVSDTGIGVPADKLEKIFDSFSQVDSSITRKYGGTGLGLGISRQLVELMGGSLTATSRLGEGSIFRFNVQCELTENAQHKTPSEVADFHGRRILVIDENATNRFILEETLSTWGMESAGFDAPAAALESLQEAITTHRPFALVLLDREMRGPDGFETTAHIKQIAPNLPVVMFTSDVRPGDIQRRREAGISGYGVKPVSRGEVLRLICAALQPPKGTQVKAPESSMHPERGPVKPMRILVAEDSPDNRLLIQMYLKASPHQVTFAEDGMVAVDLFAGGNFDLILMDMLMPVMDGLTATRAIRALGRVRRSAPIPIIALTANARPQDVELSVSAGCNQHLSKPISKQKLLAVIEAYAPATPVAEAPQTTTGKFIRIEMPPGLEEIVPGYLEARRAEMPEMLTLLAASGFARLAVLGHNLKGTGSSYGFTEITRLGAALERSAKQTDPEALGTQLAALNDYLSRVELFTKV